MAPVEAGGGVKMRDHHGNFIKIPQNSAERGLLYVFDGPHIPRIGRGTAKYVVEAAAAALLQELVVGDFPCSWPAVSVAKIDCHNFHSGKHQCLR